MNERIKELADQVDKEFDNPGARHKAIEKFAKLIVKECFTKLTPYMDDQFINDIEAELNEHFGIKE